MRTIRRIISVLVVVSLSLSAAGGPVLDDPETWDAGLAGWTKAAPIGTGITTLGNPFQYLQITFGSQAPGLPTFEEDTIYTTAVNDIGNFQIAHLNIRFNFLAEDVLPLDSAIYLHETGAPVGDFWTLSFDNTSVGSMEEHTLSFNYDVGWAGPGDATDFWTALASVDWIGINIARRLDWIRFNRTTGWTIGNT